MPILWEDLCVGHGIKINFAYRTFSWTNEAKGKAAVHCVIIGFSLYDRPAKFLFEYEDGVIQKHTVPHINGYLTGASDVFVALRGKPQAGYPKLVQGSKPWDGGFLLLSESEKDELLCAQPTAAAFVKRYVGSSEFINNTKRYCLWLNGVTPSAYRNMPEIMERLAGVKKVRQKTKTVAVQQLAETPMLFAQIRQPLTDYILVPETSSERRRYIPIGFMSKDVIASNATLVAEHATLYHFGILTSNIHMAWMRTVCGRLKSDYRYSPSVYNNFPWPTPTDTQKAAIEAAAQGVLDARALFEGSSLADLYDPLTMPPELLKAHQRLDKAVWAAYGFTPRTHPSEASVVASLMEMWRGCVRRSDI